MSKDNEPFGNFSFINITSSFRRAFQYMKYSFHVSFGKLTVIKKLLE